jgi:magnesium chelatase family protein
VLNALRQPLEEGSVTLARSQGSTRFAARIQLVLAANPCPCGSPQGVGCTCSPQARRTYFHRLSGPLLDRIDLQVTLKPVGAAALVSQPDIQETSAQVLKRVVAAREAAAQRWTGRGFSVNAHAPGALLRCPPFRLPSPITRVLAERVDRGTLSARGYDRVLRTAWTIVDIDGRTSPTADDVREALELRTGET